MRDRCLPRRSPSLAEHRVSATTAHEADAVVDEPDEPMPALLPRLLTVPDAARLLGIGRTTAYELISDGKLEIVKIGRSTRVPLDAVDNFVDGLRGLPGRDPHGPPGQSRR